MNGFPTIYFVKKGPVIKKHEGGAHKKGNRRGVRNIFEGVMTEPLLFKTELCRNWTDLGRCPYGGELQVRARKGGTPPVAEKRGTTIGVSRVRVRGRVRVRREVLFRARASARVGETPRACEVRRRDTSRVGRSSRRTWCRLLRDESATTQASDISSSSGRVIN